MIDWNEVGYPGTSVFDGMTAAANWNTRALANVDAVNKLREWHLNTNLRKAARDIKEDELLTAAQIGAQVNKNLRLINQHNNELYRGKDGMMNVLNAIDPLSNGAFRRLSSDGKTIETVGVDGSVINTQPNYTGKTAERALLQNYGLGAMMEREQFFPREQFELGLNARLAQQRDATAAELEKLKMQVLLGGLGGLGGRGRGGRGGSGSGGEDSDKTRNPFSKESYSDFMGSVASHAATTLGLPVTEKGQPDFMNMTPEQKKEFDAAYQAILGMSMQGIYTNRWAPGQSLYNAGNLFLLGRADQANRAALSRYGLNVFEDIVGPALRTRPSGLPTGTHSNRLSGNVMPYNISPTSGLPYPGIIF